MDGGKAGHARGDLDGAHSDQLVERLLQGGDRSDALIGNCEGIAALGDHFAGEAGIAAGLVAKAPGVAVDQDATLFSIVVQVSRPPRAAIDITTNRS